MNAPAANAAASPATSTSTITPAMRRVMDHDNTQVAWVCRAEGGKIIRMAQINVLPGTGTVQVLVRSWGESGREPCVFSYGKASGYGYEKVAAALAGANIAGVKVTDHGPQSLLAVCDQKGWEVIGGNFNLSR